MAASPPQWLWEAAQTLPPSVRGTAIGFMVSGYLAGFEAGREHAASGVDFANVPRPVDADPGEARSEVTDGR